jgi:hypothetical protein
MVNRDIPIIGQEVSIEVGLLEVDPILRVKWLVKVDVEYVAK